MVNLVKLLSLIGKSERDREVKAMMGELGISQPLLRPHRGETQINFEVKNLPLEICFMVGDQLPVPQSDWAEGELVLDSVFVMPSPSEIDDRIVRTLPFGLNQKMSRKEVRAKLGAPLWTSPVLPNDRWVLNDFRVLVCFTEDETRIQQIAISMAI